MNIGQCIGGYGLLMVVLSHGGCLSTSRYSNVDLRESVFTASRYTSLVDDVEPIVLTLLLRDKDKQPIVGIPVQLSAPYATITQEQLQSNSEGLIVARLTSKQVGKTIVRATLTLGNYETYFDQVVELEFFPQPNQIHTFQLITPEEMNAGVPFTTLVRALDANGQLVPTYQGRLAVSVSDPLQPNTQSIELTAENQGIIAIPIVLYTSGTHQITVRSVERVNLSRQSQPIRVHPGKAVQVELSLPDQWIAGQAESLVLTIKDGFGNVIPTYQGSLTILQNNQVIANFTMGLEHGGVQRLPHTIDTVGVYTFYAFSPQDTSILSSPQTVQVRSGQGTLFSLAYANANITHRSTSSFTVTVTDSWGNIAQDANAVFNITLTDLANDANYPLSSCPASVHLTSDANGQVTFECSFNRLGLHHLVIQADTMTPVENYPVTLEVLRVIAIDTNYESAQDQSTCALLSNRKLKCWGGNTTGQLAAGDLLTRGLSLDQMGQHLPYVQLGTNRSVLQYSLGSGYACAVLDDGGLKCWGDNYDKQAYDDRFTRGIDPMTIGDNLPGLYFGADRRVIQVATGSINTCVLLDDFELKCFGSAVNLGYDTPNGTSLGASHTKPVLSLGTNRHAISVKKSRYSTNCALLDNQRLKCWGGNSVAELGLGDWVDRNSSSQMGDNLPFTPLGTNRRVVDYSLGSWHLCALLDNAKLVCWGYGYWGELGNGYVGGLVIGDNLSEMGDAMPNIQLGTGRFAKKVEAGIWATCILLDNDQVKCFGSNGYGENDAGIVGTMGYQITGYASVQMGDALPYIDLGTNRTVVDLVATNYMGCALLDNGLVKCWGGNVSGNLGLGDRQARGTSASHMGDHLPFVPLW